MSNSFDIYVKEFNKNSWNRYTEGCKKSKTKIKDVPQDIVDAVSRVVGENNATEWFYKPLEGFDGKNAIEVMKMSSGEKALKAFIMRMPW